MLQYIYDVHTIHKSKYIESTKIPILNLKLEIVNMQTEHVTYIFHSGVCVICVFVWRGVNILSGGGMGNFSPTL